MVGLYKASYRFDVVLNNVVGEKKNLTK